MSETELNLSVLSSSVSIATRLWAGSSGVGISVGTKDFSFFPKRPGRIPQPPFQWVPGFFPSV